MPGFIGDPLRLRKSCWHGMGMAARPISRAAFEAYLQGPAANNNRKMVQTVLSIEKIIILDLAHPSIWSLRYRTLSGSLLYLRERRFILCHESVPSMSLKRSSTCAHWIHTSSTPLLMLLFVRPGLLTCFRGLSSHRQLPLSR